jgi:predicted dehydrogenase
MTDSERTNALTQSDPVRAAIVGLGRWGQRLVTANAGNPGSGLSFTRAATRTPQKAQAFCAEHGLSMSPDLDALLDCDDLDAIVLATPHTQHAAQVRAIAATGRHVFVEKPLALGLSDARAAVAACEAAGVTLAVGFNRRFMPGYRFLNAAVTDGTLGTPMHVEGSFCGAFGYGYSDDMWRGSTEENPAGGMAAMGIHVLDAMIAALGPIRRVSTLSRRLALTCSLDDTTNVQMEFASGATGSLSTLMATASFWRLQAFGSKGWAHMPEEHRCVIAGIDAAPREFAFDPVDSVAEELACFADAARGGAAYPVTGAQALAGVAAMEAIAISAKAGGDWVEVAGV